MLFNQLKPEKQEVALETLRKTNELYLTVYHCASERIIKALFLANGGGLLALITFIELTQKSYQIFWYPILWFVLGFIMVLFLVIVDYLTTFTNFILFAKKSKEYLSNKLEWEDIYKIDACKRIVIILPILLGILSIICFISASYVIYNIL